MELKQTGKSLQTFLNESPCNFIATETIAQHLEKAGYKKLSQKDDWKAKPGDKIYFTKNDSSIYAVKVGKANIAENGFRIITAHSDSPCFRIKPNPEITTEGGIVKLNTEVYGGPILYTWFDRPLSVAGRVLLRGESALAPVTKLVNIKRPILIIPHLPIHFNRAVNEGNPLSKQKDMLPILGIVTEEAERNNMLINVICDELQVEKNEIIDFDLLLYPTEGATLVGAHSEFICSARIDDLSMAHAAMTALIESEDDNQATLVMGIFDNEETGSGTKQGAASPVLANILRRIVLSQNGNESDFIQATANSFMISADNGHAFHPNYGEKFDPTNHPVQGGGPIIKINANCKYMTDAKSAAVFAEICRRANVPVQYFVNHSDVAGGSTLGNIFTGQMEIEGVDVGNPIWAMHSCCETGTVIDQYYMIKAFTTFYNE
ncbi:MAG: M18 family aminopeptidase [Muribaculaceae bacterium]|nr:M18 family aminopeptidase [Muribaculaceae bacterium]